MIRYTHTRFDFGHLAQDYNRWYDTARGKAHDGLDLESGRLYRFGGRNTDGRR